jgi:multimeric flavodoxin WrbA
MRILALQGSPRPEGNTQALLEPALAAARQAGAETETIRLSELHNLTGCMECFACREKPDELGCAITDDLLTVLYKALKADLILWATPVFCWSPAWPLKLALDRCYCTFKPEGDGIRSLLRGRKMAALITAAGGEEGGADLVTETLRRMSRFSECEWRGAFVADSVTSPEEIRADAALVERARAFGRELAS